MQLIIKTPYRDQNWKIGPKARLYYLSPKPENRTKNGYTIRNQSTVTTKTKNECRVWKTHHRKRENRTQKSVTHWIRTTLTPDRNISFYSGRGVSSKHSTEAKTGNRTLKSVTQKKTSAGYQKYTTETKTGKSDPKSDTHRIRTALTPDRNIRHFYSGKRGVSSKHSTEVKTGNRTLKSVTQFETNQTVTTKKKWVHKEFRVVPIIY